MSLIQVIGHHKIKKQLLGSIQRARLPHALLFSGPSGVGKKKIALFLLQGLVCEQNLLGEESCGQCAPCKRVFYQTYEHLKIVNPESTQIKIAQAQEILHFLSFDTGKAPRMVIIKEAQKLNSSAANALLKILEEPPQNSYIILISSSAYGVLPTIRSRCQTLGFSPLSHKELQELRPCTGEEVSTSWAIQASRGQVNKYDELFSDNDLREISAEAYSDLIRGSVRKAFYKIKPLLSDLDKSLKITYFWQLFLRDAWFLKSGAEVLMGDIEKSLIEDLSEKPLDQLDLFWNRSLELEKGLKANLDKSLCIESYFYYVYNLCK